ncbi:Gfo/Idh/MocA family oxidoreductase [Pelagicoccus sp. SDUM812002]|uniref:Gfo/Idh/MocA family protein n=1 Tax=Pelagicoccus sp. SDUM812002 TaxID=3041266 RepID=UPI00280FD163|nr:Gfo/Idh/MocA family oxidoreductase [Pelagicoccus sp. SDUM812002]MDQ8188388.1 Gfo/Idh/MocA family oxidoreductase [Pelagicoccus sp. SDUM812002]
MTQRLRVGILGCGVIAPAYLKNLTGDLSALVDISACADLDHKLAQKLAEAHEIKKVLGAEALLADPDIDLVINLTPAPVHFKTSLQILNSGKHLFTEKPLSLSLAEARELLDTAERNGVQIGGAADTFLGGSFHHCSKLIAEEAIGFPVVAHALISVGTYDSKRYHKVFSGALLDLGPYYFTAMVMLFGSVTRVSGIADIRFPEKVDKSSGETFTLDRASTAIASVSFESGVVATVIASEDVHGYFPSVEVFGRKGRMALSDANMYGESIRVETYAETRKISASSDHGYTSKGRGLGVAEMALALREGRTPRSSGALMYHVLEAMLAVYESSNSGSHVKIESRVPAFEPLSESELNSILGK